MDERNCDKCVVLAWCKTGRRGRWRKIRVPSVVTVQFKLVQVLLFKVIGSPEAYTTKHKRRTSITSGGFQTLILSSHAASDLYLRKRGHHNRLCWRVWVVNCDTMILMCTCSDDFNDQLYSRYHSHVWPVVAVQLRYSTARSRPSVFFFFDMGEVGVPTQLI
jgi:hypothetical protein